MASKKEMKETAAKAAVKVEEVKKAAEEKGKEIIKEAEKKAEGVKKAAKRAGKRDFKTDIILQYGEKEVNAKDMVAAVKKEWTRTRHKVSDIKTMELYVKPEDYAVYYVINGDTTGKVWL